MLRPSDLAVRAAGFIETVQDKIKRYEAHIAAVPEDRPRYERPIKRSEELLVPLKSPDPWGRTGHLSQTRTFTESQRGLATDTGRGS
jgi:hypothetical protein